MPVTPGQATAKRRLSGKRDSAGPSTLREVLEVKSPKAATAPAGRAGSKGPPGTNTRKTTTAVQALDNMKELAGKKKGQTPRTSPDAQEARAKKKWAAIAQKYQAEGRAPDLTPISLGGGSGGGATAKEGGGRDKRSGSKLVLSGVER